MAPRNIRVKQGRGPSLAGFIAGIIFILIGLGTISIFGWFGAVWTLMALLITVFHGINAFSDKGVPVYEVTMSDEEGVQAVDYAAQLRNLRELLEDGIITETEYNIKKEEILSKKW